MASWYFRQEQYMPVLWYAWPFWRCWNGMLQGWCKIL